MADLTQRTPENVPGRFYVDDTCIDCDLCHETAPANFTRNEEEGRNFVFRQPQTPKEEELCQWALDACPVEAIGNDAPPQESSSAAQP